MGRVPKNVPSRMVSTCFDYTVLIEKSESEPKASQEPSR